MTTMKEFVIACAESIAQRPDQMFDAELVPIDPHAPVRGRLMFFPAGMDAETWFADRRAAELKAVEVAYASAYSRA